MLRAAMKDGDVGFVARIGDGALPNGHKRIFCHGTWPVRTIRIGTGPSSVSGSV